MTYRYKTVKVNGKTKMLHRHLMEQHLGRPLLPDEIVHHINGERWDNRVENLEVTTHKEHSQHHNQKYPMSKSCAVCGMTFVPAPTKRGRRQCCSPECRQKLIWQKRWG